MYSRCVWSCSTEIEMESALNFVLNIYDKKVDKHLKSKELNFSSLVHNLCSSFCWERTVNLVYFNLSVSCVPASSIYSFLLE